MLMRFASAFICVLSTTTVVSAHPMTFARAPIVAGGVRPGTLRLGVQATVGHPGPVPNAQPFTPLHLQLRKVEPAPAASPEWNPLKRRRMAMPGTLPGPDPDFAF